ncbi:hypothetical protein RFI_31354 [Reticulomyxa filosa]|uniref:VWFA domain-containing protein n=1 Tax=Reticulomyxa filosa TaxID=46433 RepID=X6LY14_RETFI|nr:hypothetical protein RFI_31354 [Reticulomyxa filosa]|eukprot:ETO06042.1 hypothetical protein RFI_31354 [Reticulomyxa filosa]
MNETLNIFKTQASKKGRDRLMLLITDGNPVPKSQDPCPLVPMLDQEKIDRLIVGVGSDWSTQKIGCLVNYDSERLIPVNSTHPQDTRLIRDQLDVLLCPNNYQVWLSEIKPMAEVTNINTTNNNTNGEQQHRESSNVRFVELYNHGIPLDLSKELITLTGLVNGLISVNDIYYMPWGTQYEWNSLQYLVLFDYDALTTPECFECVCNMTSHLCDESIYVGCRSNNSYTNQGCWFDETNAANMTYWTQNALDMSVSLQLFDVTYGQGPYESTWPIASQGHSYEVTDITHCSSKYGYCWQPSCSVYGTPGDKPISICDEPCTLSSCRANGDDYANVSDSGAQCICSSHDHFFALYGSCSCIHLDYPTNCSVNVINIPALDATQGYVYWDAVTVNILHL